MKKLTPFVAYLLVCLASCISSFADNSVPFAFAEYLKILKQLVAIVSFNILPMLSCTNFDRPALPEQNKSNISRPTHAQSYRLIFDGSFGFACFQYRGSKISKSAKFKGCYNMLAVGSIVFVSEDDLNFWAYSLGY